MPKVEVIREFSHMESLRLHWTRLTQSMESPFLCHSLDWYLNHWDQFEGRLVTVVAKAKHNVVGIVPLLVELHNVGSVRRNQSLTLRPVPLPGCPFWSPVGKQQSATLAILAQYLNQLPNWNRFEIDAYRDRPKDIGRLEAALACSRFRLRRSPGQAQASVVIDGFFHDYCRAQQISPKTGMPPLRFHRLEEDFELIEPDFWSSTTASWRQTAWSRGNLDVAFVKTTEGKIIASACGNRFDRNVVSGIEFEFARSSDQDTLREFISHQLIQDAFARKEEKLYFQPDTIDLKWCNRFEKTVRCDVQQPLGIRGILRRFGNND